MGEAHIPTKQPQAQAQARIPAPNADSGGPSGSGAPSWARSQDPVGLIWRVRARRDFAVLRYGPRFRRRHLSVSVAVLADDSTPPMVAYAIGKNIGSAPVRNRVRRRLLVIARDHRAGFREGFGYLVQVRPGIERLPFSELRHEFLGAVRDSALQGDTGVTQP